MKARRINKISSGPLYQSCTPARLHACVVPRTSCRGWSRRPHPKGAPSATDSHPTPDEQSKLQCKRPPNHLLPSSHGNRLVFPAAPTRSRCSELTAKIGFAWSSGRTRLARTRYRVFGFLANSMPPLRVCCAPLPNLGNVRLDRRTLTLNYGFPNRRAVLQVVCKRLAGGDCPLCARIVAIGAPGAVATFKGEDAGLGTLPASLRKVLVISYAGLGWSSVIPSLGVPSSMRLLAVTGRRNFAVCSLVEGRWPT